MTTVLVFRGLMLPHPGLRSSLATALPSSASLRGEKTGSENPCQGQQDYAPETSVLRARPFPRQGNRSQTSSQAGEGQRAGPRPCAPATPPPLPTHVDVKRGAPARARGSVLVLPRPPRGGASEPSWRPFAAAGLGPREGLAPLAERPVARVRTRAREKPGGGAYGARRAGRGGGGGSGAAARAEGLGLRGPRPLSEHRAMEAPGGRSACWAPTPSPQPPCRPFSGGWRCSGAAPRGMAPHRERVLDRSRTC